MSLDLKALVTIREATRAMIGQASRHERLSIEIERKSRSAVLFEIVIQGEGLKRLSLDSRNRHPAIPCAQIAGMSDRLVHSLEVIDFDIVREVAQTIAPGLLVDVDRVIAEGSQT